MLQNATLLFITLKANHLWVIFIFGQFTQTLETTSSMQPVFTDYTLNHFIGYSIFWIRIRTMTNAIKASEVLVVPKSKSYIRNQIDETKGGFQWMTASYVLYEKKDLRRFFFFKAILTLSYDSWRRFLKAILETILRDDFGTCWMLNYIGICPTTLEHYSNLRKSSPAE